MAGEGAEVANHVEATVVPSTSATQSPSASSYPTHVGESRFKSSICHLSAASRARWWCGSG